MKLIHFDLVMYVLFSVLHIQHEVFCFLGGVFLQVMPFWLSEKDGKSEDVRTESLSKCLHRLQYI